MAFMGILIYWIKKLLLCVMVYITVFFVGIVLLVIGIIIQNKILKIISLVIIAIKGNKLAKKYFLLIPILYAITIYNPIFTKIITRYFTGSEVFWRLFWLLPIELSIVYSFVLLLELKNSKLYKIGMLIIEILLLIVMGKFVYTKQNGFEIAENLNKIPQTIIDQTRIHIGYSIKRFKSRNKCCNDFTRTTT